MCKCTQTDGYVQAMQNAISVEKKTGVEQAVFIKNGISYFGKREDVAKQEGICCYILTTGEEIQIEAEKNATEVKTEIPEDFESQKELPAESEQEMEYKKTADEDKDSKKKWLKHLKDKEKEKDDKK